MIKFEKNSNGRWIANGDRNYFSPERQKANDNDRPFDAELSDHYSVGLALWELVTGEKVKEYRDKVNYEDEYKYQVLLEHPKLKQQYSQDSLEDLVIKMLSPNVNERWDIIKALNHPCFQNGECHDPQMKSIVIDYLDKFVRSINNQKINNQDMDIIQ